MQPSSLVHSVPPRKKLREGQRRVIKRALDKRSGVLPIQLPTGYGKTLTAAATFVELRNAGVVNRLLYLVPTLTQLDQFTRDGSGDFLDAGLAGVRIIDVGKEAILAIKEHRKNKTIVFAATIQALSCNGNATMAVREMMETGQWMVVVDEYHHYGLDKAWGRAALDLNSVFTLAMSATPERKGQDSAFGKPEIPVKYRDAVEEQAAKRLRLHSYEYRIDAVTVNGEEVSFTTTELAEKAGSSDPKDVDEFMRGVADKRMRWSPRYISPLISIPVERLLRRRRNLPLQMIVGTMGCIHAQVVCGQIQEMFGDILRVDWVGTGPHGRSDAENEAIIRKFCPPKVNGVRRPSDVQLDVLVHVGMAGEGLDSVFVSEVVHLNPASISNQNDQENGRASRRIPGAPEDLQVAYINVDSSSPYAEWSGERIMDVFDRENGEGPPPLSEHEEREPSDGYELPDEPLVVIANCELENIDKGDPEVRFYADILAKKTEGWSVADLDNPDHPLWDYAIKLRRRELEEVAKSADVMTTIGQLKDTLTSSVRSVAGLAARKVYGRACDTKAVGSKAKRIWGEMKRRRGSGIDGADEQELRDRYKFVRDLDRQIRTSGVPGWLAK